MKNRIIRNTFYAQLAAYIVASMASTIGHLVDGVVIGQCLGVESTAAFGVVSPLMVAFAIQSRMTEFLTAEDATFVKNAGKENMEIIVKKKNKITRYKSEKSTGSGRGRRVGIAYQLESGEVIYVPEGGK